MWCRYLDNVCRQLDRLLSFNRWASEMTSCPLPPLTVYTAGMSKWRVSRLCWVEPDWLFWVTCCGSPPLSRFIAGSGACRQAGLEGVLVCRIGPGSSAVSRCRQSDLPGTPWRIRATSAGTGRGATWGDVSHTDYTLHELEGWLWKTVWEKPGDCYF